MNALIAYLLVHLLVGLWFIAEVRPGTALQDAMLVIFWPAHVIIELLKK